MDNPSREGLEEYALTLDLKPEEVLALLDRAMADAEGSAGTGN